MLTEIKRGQIYMADLNPVIGSEQGGIRPVVIIQNDRGNYFSPTVIVAAITGQVKKELPTHTKIKTTGLPKESTALLEQIRTVDKTRLLEKIGEVSVDEMNRITEALRVSIDV
jgi:mRNA interferase MazF